MRGTSGVVVEAFAGLASELAARHHVAKDPGRREPFAEGLMQVFGDSGTDVQSHDVRGAQRTRGMSAAEFHSGVDVLGSGHAVLQHPHGLQGQRNAQARTREAWCIVDHDRGLAQATHPAGSGAGELPGGPGSKDNFHKR